MAQHIYTANTELTQLAERANHRARYEALPLRQLLWAAAALGTVLILAGAAGLAYIWFSGGSGQPGSALVAPALTLKPGDTRTLFHIVPEESQVRFIIEEILLGNPKTVIGMTDQVAGDMLVDFDQPENSQAGAFRINLRTLATDNEIRNRALRGQILQSERDEYEFAEFTPVALTGLPAFITPGQPVEFEMTGSLTVHGVTREVKFEVNLESVTKSRLDGTAVTTVQYRDFGINIPEAPGVAGVSDEVRVEIDLAAVAENAS